MHLDRVVLVVVRHHIRPLENIAPGDFKVLRERRLALLTVPPCFNLDDWVNTTQ